MNDPSTTFHSAQGESSLTLRSAQEGGGKFLIGIVGVCGSGKSTLIAGLKAHGYHCRHIAQEHSYVPAMWQIVTNPDLLIYLQTSFENSTSRRKLNWMQADYEEQLHRLAHARQNANLVIDTDSLTPDEVLAKAVQYLKGNRL